jgi:hypothetical protein
MTRNKIQHVQAPPGDAGFIDETELISRLKISRGTAINHRKAGLLPFVKLGHAVRYHWPTVEAALLRQQRGGVA